MKQFLRCIDCEEGFMQTPFDQSPEYEYDPAHRSGPPQVVEQHDFQDFLSAHHGHQLESLNIIDDSFVSEKTYLEPVKTSYFKAINAKKEKFVVKRFRETIGEKLRYQIIPGDYFVECAGVEVQSEEITKQLKIESKAHPFSETQISKFLKLYRRIVRGIDIRKLERTEGSSHPLEEFYKMDDVSLYYLLRNCRNIFKGKEYFNIEDFIYRHKDDGVLLLKARYKIQINKKPNTKTNCLNCSGEKDKKGVRKE
jgi:hypothetical protein